MRTYPRKALLAGQRLLRGSRSLGRAVWSGSTTSLQIALELLYPPVCAFCNRDMEEPTGAFRLCGTCCEQLAAPPGPLCRRCAQSVPELQDGAEDCSQCRGRKLHFDSATALGRYEADLRAAVLRMKHAADEPLALAIGSVIADRHKHLLGERRWDAIVAVPMHWSRRAFRGTNSPEVIARCIARQLGAPAEPRILIRRRRTASQGNLPRSKRLRNLRGAFRASKAYDLAGARLLLVDDVMTTGATANQCARTLKLAGAERVDVLVVARADLPR